MIMVLSLSCSPETSMEGMVPDMARGRPVVAIVCEGGGEWGERGGGGCGERGGGGWETLNRDADRAGETDASVECSPRAVSNDAKP